ncbi:MAG TPA: glycosyltransferase [Chitinophagaceae bacterium]|nr:glycosyltransferase [Chitinophagaceae bacterium]
MSKTPLVTIASLFYNTGPRIVETLNSLLSQTYDNIQLIILDDASSDNSVLIIEKWISDHNVQCQFIKHQQNKGICSSLNEILLVAKGEFIAFIGDDIMMQDKIRNDVEFMIANPEFGFCHSNVLAYFLQSGKEVLLKGNDSKNAFHDFFSWKMVIYSPTIFYRKNVFDEVGPYDESLSFEDYDMILRIAYQFKAGYRDETTIKYIITGKSISVKKSDTIVEQSLKVTNKWKFLKNYSYYLSRRHLSLFYNLAQTQKLKALKFVPRSLKFISDKRLYSSIYRLIFKW